MACHTDFQGGLYGSLLSGIKPPKIDLQTRDAFSQSAATSHPRCLAVCPRKQFAYVSWDNTSFDAGKLCWGFLTLGNGSTGCVRYRSTSNLLPKSKEIFVRKKSSNECLNPWVTGQTSAQRIDGTYKPSNAHTQTSCVSATLMAMSRSVDEDLPNSSVPGLRLLGGNRTRSNRSDWRVWAERVGKSTSSSETVLQAGHRGEVVQVADSRVPYETCDGDSLMGEDRARGIGLFQHRSTKIEDILNSITQLCMEGAEAEHTLQDEEELQQLEEAEFVEDRGRQPADYSRRADIFGKNGEIVAARKRKEEKLEEMFVEVEKMVMEKDTGRTAEDYSRRTQIFSKFAEIVSPKWK